MLRGYIPSTFDQMMVDFGSRHERKELLESYDLSSDAIIQAPLPSGDIEKMTNRMTDHANLFSRIVRMSTGSGQSENVMNSVENYLFRKTRE